MTEPKLPLWLDPTRRPEGDRRGQPVWAFGMWWFVPFSEGLALLPLCATLSAARQAARFFETTSVARKLEVDAFRAAGLNEIADEVFEALERWRAESIMVSSNSDDDEDIPHGRTIVRLPDSKWHVVVDADGRIREPAMESYAIALFEIRKAAALGI